MGAVIDGQTLRAMREARGWNQSTLARTAGIHPSVISRIERGMQDNLDADVLVALARSLQAPVDALLVTPDKPGEHGRGRLMRELAAEVAVLAELSDTQQRQVAAIVRAYRATLPGNGEDHRPHDDGRDDVSIDNEE